MKRALPDHVAWPALVILLLLIGMGSAFALLYASTSDGGAQVVDEYRPAPTGGG